MQIIDYVDNGATSSIFRVDLFLAADGQGATGLTFESTGLIISTIASSEASAVVYTEAGSTIESIDTLATFAAPTATKCRFKEIDATNSPGAYELQFADARLAVSNARYLDVTITFSTLLDQPARIFLDLSTQADLKEQLRSQLEDEAIGGSPTTDSMAERIKTLDDAYTATRAGYIDNINGHTAQTGDNFVRIGTPAGASIAADIVAILTTQMTESYAADGVAPTMAQSAFLIQQVLTDFAITGTLYSIKGVDGSTEKAVLTLNDAFNPTSATRSS